MEGVPLNKAKKLEKKVLAQTEALVTPNGEVGEGAPEGWVTRRFLTKELGVSYGIIDNILDPYRTSHPEWFKEYKTQSAVREHCSPELTQIVREDIKSRVKAPDGWVNNLGLAKQIGRSYKYVERRAGKYRKSNPEWFKEYREEQGNRVTEYYSPELVGLITEEASQGEEAPEGWVTLNKASEDLGVNYKTIGKIARQFPSENEIKMARDRTGKMVLFYSPEILAKVKAELDNLSPLPGYRALMDIAREVNKSYGTVERQAELFATEHPEWIRKLKEGSGAIKKSYSPELVTMLIDYFSDLKEVPSEWITKEQASGMVGISKGAIQVAVSIIREEHPDWIKIGIGKKGVRAEYYSPQLIDALRERFGNRDKAPEGWKTATAVADELHKINSIIYEIANKYRKTNPEWFKEYKTQSAVREHYSPLLIDKIQKQLTEEMDVPQGWKTTGTIVSEKNASYIQVQLRIKKFLEDHSKEEHVKILRSSATGRFHEFYSPEMVEYIEDSINERQNIRKLNKEEELLLGKVQDALEEISTPETIEAQKFKKLLGVFGAAQAADLLYALHPEFQGIPIERVKQNLAEYLGNYLYTSVPFTPDTLKEVAIYLTDRNLRQGFIQVIKNDALRTVLSQKGATSEELKEYLRNYFDNLNKEIEDITSVELHEVLEEVDAYYQSLFEDDLKPDHMVNSLREGREFPDVYQKINVKEIADKKRLLIADEMGVGKSASAIIAKEVLGTSLALVLAPANTLPTWQTYLSDEVGTDGTQLGYFKTGQAPRVLMVEDLDSISGLNVEDWDYIVISHERLNDHYAEALKQLPYEMIIVDEIHKLKNIRGGIRSSALMDLASKIEGQNKYLALLSGTPVPNKVEDVAVLLKLLHPDKFDDQDNAALVSAIIHGDLIDLRTLLIPYMQMKSLSDHVEMPELREHTIETELSPQEAAIYQVLLDEDELTPTEKMQVLRQFLVNHDLLEVTPGLPNSKVEGIKAELNEVFSRKDKAVLFVNDYIEDVIRGEHSIIPRLQLPLDVDIRVIHGETTMQERIQIQGDFKQKPGKILLIVSGKTADVGVDYSAGEHISFYNEPWTKAAKDQQEARVYRPGVQGDIDSTTHITRNTIEEGIHRYIEAKYRAVNKLLKGIPITETEQEMLIKSETSEPDLEVNAELAEYYFSAFDKMNKIFASVKEMGERDFSAFLEKYGADYADCYTELGSRSYQGNASRVCAAIINHMIQEQGMENPRILDIASGPEMLRQHSKDSLQGNVISMDINPHHFLDKDGRGQAVVGGFSRLPFADGSFDYANMSLALHYSKFVPSRGEFERAKALEEMARVLKDGGRAVINMIYSLDIKDMKAFSEVAELFGLRVMDDYSGEATAGTNYGSHVITIEKVKGIGQSVEEIIPNLLKEDLDGLKFSRTDVRLRDQRRIISKFKLGDREFPIEFNSRDQELRREEQRILDQGEELKHKYGSIADIPREEVIDNKFIRLRMGKKYVLFKEIADAGAVVIK